MTKKRELGDKSYRELVTSDPGYKLFIPSTQTYEQRLIQQESNRVDRVINMHKKEELASFLLDAIGPLKSKPLIDSLNGKIEPVENVGFGQYEFKSGDIVLSKQNDRGQVFRSVYDCFTRPRVEGGNVIGCSYSKGDLSVLEVIFDKNPGTVINYTPKGYSLSEKHSAGCELRLVESDDDETYFTKNAVAFSEKHGFCSIAYINTNEFLPIAIDFMCEVFFKRYSIMGHKYTNNPKDKDVISLLTSADENRILTNILKDSQRYKRMVEDHTPGLLVRIETNPMDVESIRKDDGAKIYLRRVWEDKNISLHAEPIYLGPCVVMTYLYKEGLGVVIVGMNYRNETGNKEWINCVKYLAKPEVKLMEIIKEKTSEKTSEKISEKTSEKYFSALHHDWPGLLNVLKEKATSCGIYSVEGHTLFVYTKIMFSKNVVSCFLSDHGFLEFYVDKHMVPTITMYSSGKDIGKNVVPALPAPLPVHKVWPTPMPAVEMLRLKAPVKDELKTVCVICQKPCVKTPYRGKYLSWCDECKR